MPDAPMTRQEVSRLGGLASGKALTAAQRRQRARVAALERWSREDPAATAERGQAGLFEKFRREIAAEFPDLSDAELTRRAEARRRAHMERMSFAASRARTLKAREAKDAGG